MLREFQENMAESEIPCFCIWLSLHKDTNMGFIMWFTEGNFSYFKKFGLFYIFTIQYQYLVFNFNFFYNTKI